MIIFFIVIKEKQLVWFLISRYVYKLRGNVLMEPWCSRAPVADTGCDCG